MKNLGQLMKQAQEMQSRVQEMQEKLEDAEVTGAAGAGMVKVTLNGKADMKRVEIDPSAFDPSDTAILEDLIIAAYNDAKVKVDAMVKEQMSEITGGLPLPPGMNPFG